MYHIIVCSFGLFAIYNGVRSIELPVPERDLEPRNFNYHPYAATPLTLSNFDHPYAVLSAKLSRRRKGGTKDTHDINHVSPYDSLEEYVFRVLGTLGRKGDNAVPASSVHSSRIKNGQKPKNHHGQYKAVSLPDSHLRIVNYNMANDDSYRADVSLYEQEVRSITKNVQDLSGKKNVLAGSALQSANSAEILSEMEKQKNGIYEGSLHNDPFSDSSAYQTDPIVSCRIMLPAELNYDNPSHDNRYHCYFDSTSGSILARKLPVSVDLADDRHFFTVVLGES